MRRARQGGFTLVELMIALLVSSLLVGLILAIFLRLSFAYRSQQQVASVQQVLAAGRGALEIDAKHAGAHMSQGFRIAADNDLRLPVRIVNSNAGPDQVGFYYADLSVRAEARPGSDRIVANVDQTVGFVDGELVVMSTADEATNPADGFNLETIVTHEACVLQLASHTANQLTFAQVPPWGTGTNDFCRLPQMTPFVPSGPTVKVTRYFKLVARYYRIDPGRPGEGVLQVSPTGNLGGLADWRDLGYGFTDLQIATRFYQQFDAGDSDGDGDAERDWDSGADQQTKTDPFGGVAFPWVPLEMSISLVARTEREVEGIASTATPALIQGGPDHNPIGDRPSVDLTTTTDPTLTGQRIFRHTTFRVDLRNLGVGR